MALPVRPPVASTLAKLTRTLPAGDYVYEPKWDGFRALVFRDDAAVEVWSRAEKRLDRYFPELVDAMRALPEPRFVLDGEIVVVSGGALDFTALMGRLHPTPSRIARLRTESPALFIAFDALSIGDVDLRREPFARRRASLEALLGDSAPQNVVLTPSTTSLAGAERWLAGTGAGIDGVVA